MRRLLFAVSSALLAVCGLLAFLPAPAHASTILVTDCTSNGVLVALNFAGDGDVLVFACTPAAKTIVMTGTAVISRPLTLDGGGTITLSGGDKVPILSINAGGALTLTNIRLTDGSAGTSGGALSLSDGASALVSSTIFIGNVVSATGFTSGGAIYSHGTLRVVNSQFFSNTANASFGSGSGGAIYSSGILTVENSLFSANDADFGGAIRTSFGLNLDIRNSTFAGNSASIFGGAMYLLGPSTIRRSVFMQNNAASSGAIESQPSFGASALIAESTFFSNTAHTGGAMRVLGPTTLDQLVFQGNYAAEFGGGALLNGDRATVSNSQFVANSTAAGGGAIHNDGVLTASASVFMSNASVGSGGAISNTGRLVVSGSTFLDNSTTAPSALGGAIAVAFTGTLDVDYSNFAFNHSAAGGAIAVMPGAVASVQRSALLTNTAATGGGGAILNNGVLSLTNSTLTLNFSNYDGGAIFSGGGANTSILNSTLVSNTAPGGAALRSVGLSPTGTLTLKNTIVAGNASSNCQGQLANGGHNLQFGDLTCGAAIPNTDPLLGRFALNGGPTPNFALLPGSPAIDAGDNSGCPPTDQRGFARIGTCDIGAYDSVVRLLLPLIMR